MESKSKIIFEISSILQGCLTFFLDSLFPIRCLGCEKEPVWLCPACLGKLPLQTPSAVLFDRKEHPERSLDGLIAATSFRVPLVARLIHCYKYSSIEALKAPLGALLSGALHRTSLPLPHLLSFVPLHPRRLRMRGFNQAELLSQAVAEAINDPAPLVSFQSLLTRVRYTTPQIKTHSKEERLQNVRNAFLLSVDPSLIKGKTLWIVDDVATTFATLEECAQVLKAAGAKEVYGFVVAK